MTLTPDQIPVIAGVGEITERSKDFGPEFEPLALDARNQRSLIDTAAEFGFSLIFASPAPLTTVPLKGDYSKMDFARSAHFMGIPYNPPTRFPLPTQVAARAYYWLHERDCTMARAFAHAAYRALFVEDRDISSLDVVLDLAASIGADRTALAEGVESPEIKDRLKEEVAAALTKGVFGSPLIFCDGEPFFGADRLPQLEARLAGQKF